MGLDAFGAGPVLVFFVFHSDAERLLGADHDGASRDGAGLNGTSCNGAVRWALGQLAEATGRPCPEPTAVAVTSWGTDPYSRGSYSHISPGSSPADGALNSGIREAKRLLGQPSVRLGAAGS